MDRTEERLKSLALAAPPDALRARVLGAAGRGRPSEWKRLQHTVEYCAAALIAVYGWSVWFESGSEEIRRGLRTTAYTAQLSIVERQLAEALPAEADAPLRAYMVAQHMAAYARPFVPEAEERALPRMEMN